MQSCVLRAQYKNTNLYSQIQPDDKLYVRKYLYKNFYLIFYLLLYRQFTVSVNMKLYVTF